MLSKRFPAILLALLALVPTAACAQQAAKPALWELSDPDTTIYLFGTVHALPKDLNWKHGRISTAFNAADTLVVEIDTSSDSEQALRPMLAMGMAKPGSLPPLTERVPADTRDALQAMIARAPFPPAALDGFKTWLAALILVAPTVKDAGLDPATGADRVLMADASKRTMTIIGLESVEQQLGYFNSLPEADQRTLLKAVVEDEASVKQQFQDLVAAWARGDVSALERLADDDLKASPQLRQVLLASRNAHWADWIADRMKTPGKLFVAVGAGHLAGTDSVQAMLETKGLKVKRIQ